MRLTAGVIFIMALLQSCYYDKADKLYPVSVCDTVNMSFNANIRPVLNNYCVSCHNVSNSSGSVVLDTYSGTVAASSGGKLINSLSYIHSGSSTVKNMPPTGKLDACTIDKFRAWVIRGTPEN